MSTGFPVFRISDGMPSAPGAFPLSKAFIALSSSFIVGSTLSSSMIGMSGIESRVDLDTWLPVHYFGRFGRSGRLYRNQSLELLLLKRISCMTQQSPRCIDLLTIMFVKSILVQLIVFINSLTSKINTNELVFKEVVVFDTTVKLSST